jgi:hypothetical protein
MILASNRVPGQLMPVGARYWYNAGRPLNALKSVAGLSGLSGDLGAFGDTLTPEQAAAMIKAEASGQPVTDEIVVNTPSKAVAAKAAGVGAGVLLTAILIRGGLGYVAGRAMAPSAAKKNSYGWWGVLAGGVFGVTGLAVQGAVALSKK